MRLSQLVEFISNVSGLYVYINKDFYREDKARPSNLQPDFILLHTSHLNIDDYLKKEFSLGQVKECFIIEQGKLLVLLEPAEIEENSCNEEIFMV